MESIELRKRTWEEKCAFMDGYEECAKFADSYLSEEGRAKLKYIIKMVNIALAMENKEEAHENKVQSSQGNNGQA